MTKIKTRRYQDLHMIASSMSMIHLSMHVGLYEVFMFFRQSITEKWYAWFYSRDLSRTLDSRFDFFYHFYWIFMMRSPMIRCSRIAVIFFIACWLILAKDNLLTMLLFSIWLLHFLVFNLLILDYKVSYLSVMSYRILTR